MDDNRAAFSALYREHFGFAWASLLRLGVPEANVEDALQDVFVTVHRRLPEFEGRSSTRTWVFGIARRVAFRYRRSAQRAGRKLAAVASEHAERASLEDAVERKQLGALVLQALDELDDDKRAAVVLHVFDGLSGPQVAQMLDVPVDTAYSRIKAGRRLLRTRLQAMGVDAQRGAAVAEAAAQTRPRRAAQRRVAGLLAVRLGIGATAKATGAAVAWKSVAAVVGLGVVTMVSVRVATAEPNPGAAANTRALVASDPRADPAPDRRPAPSRASEASAAAVPDAAQPLPTVSVAPPNAAALPSVSSEIPRSPARASAPRTDGPSGSSKPDALRLREEVQLVESARAHLDRGEPARALQLVAEHAERFANGQLRSERAAYRAVALCELGRTTQGRGEGTVFVARHPDSPLVGRVRTACDLSEKKDRAP